MKLLCNKCGCTWNQNFSFIARNLNSDDGQNMVSIYWIQLETSLDRKRKKREKYLVTFSELFFVYFYSGF